MASYQYIFSLENLSKTWSGGKTLFENINLSFLPNAKIGIVGINGSGKSTFLKILSGIDKEYNGEIIAVKGIKVGYLPQEPDLDINKNVYENICEGAKEKLSLIEKYNDLSMNYSVTVGAENKTEAKRIAKDFEHCQHYEEVERCDGFEYKVGKMLEKTDDKWLT